MGKNHVSKLNGARPAAQSHTAHHFKKKQHDGKTYSGASVKAVRRETVPLFDIRRNALLPLLVVGTFGAVAPAAEARESRRQQFTEGARDKRSNWTPQQQADIDLCSAVHSAHVDVYREAGCALYEPSPIGGPILPTNNQLRSNDSICPAIRSVLEHGFKTHGCVDQQFWKGFAAGAGTVGGAALVGAGTYLACRAYFHHKTQINVVTPEPTVRPRSIEMNDIVGAVDVTDGLELVKNADR